MSLPQITITADFVTVVTPTVAGDLLVERNIHIPLVLHISISDAVNALREAVEEVLREAEIDTSDPLGTVDDEEEDLGMGW